MVLQGKPAGPVPDTTIEERFIYYVTKGRLGVHLPVHVNPEPGSKIQQHVKSRFKQLYECQIDGLTFDDRWGSHEKGHNHLCLRDALLCGTQ